MITYEKIAALAALAARVEIVAAMVLGSATIGERVAMLARACEEFNKAADLRRDTNEKLAEVTRIAKACNLEAYVDPHGMLYVGRPHYFVKMGSDGRRRVGL